MNKTSAAAGAYSTESPLAAPTPPEHVEVRGQLTVEDLVRHTWYRRRHDQLWATILISVLVFAAPLGVWYIQRGIAVEYVLLIGVVGLVLTHVINHWQFTAFAKKTVRRLAPLGEVVVRLSAKGIEQKTQASTGVIGWPAVSRILRTPHAIYLEIGAMTHIFPKRFFQDQDLAAVEARLVSWWRPGSLRPKLS